MTTKGFPATVVFSLGALSMIAFFGVIGVTLGFSYWYNLSNDPLPFNLLFRAVMYGIVPMLAFIDVFRRKGSGRYLAILSMLCSSALMFHAFVNFISRPAPARASQALFVMPFFGIALGLAALAVSMGFGHKVDAFFGSDLTGVDSQGHDVGETVTDLEESSLVGQPKSLFQQDVLAELTSAHQALTRAARKNRPRLTAAVPFTRHSSLATRH